MIESWLIVALLGVVASFMPTILAMEAILLGTEHGVRRVVGLLSGITLARLVIAFGVFSVFASVLQVMGLVAIWAAESAVNLLERIHALIVSDGHWTLDIIFTIAGVMLLIEAVSYARGGAVVVTSSESATTADEDAAKPSMLNNLGIGLLLTITGPQQWVLTIAAMNVILSMPPRLTVQLGALVVYLVLGVSIVSVPLLLYFVSPERAQALLATMNGWIAGAMRYLIAAILGAIGIYLIWNGGMDFARALFN